MGKLILVALALLVTNCGGAGVHPDRPLPDRGPTTTTPSTGSTPAPVKVPASGTHAWALHRGAVLAGSTNAESATATESVVEMWLAADWHRGAVLAGSANAESATATTESVVKMWLAADWLRRHGADRRTRERLTRMLSRSDDAVAESLYRDLGGEDSITRMLSVCGLRHTRAVTYWWALTMTTAADMARLGACVVDGRAAGPKWTPWLLAQLRAPHAEGEFGVFAVRPNAAYMNGWTKSPQGWQVNCLALGPGWVLAVMSQYPSQLGLAHGARVCASVAGQLAAAGRL